MKTACSTEFPYCGYKESRPAGSIGLRGGSYCRRSGSVSGWMVAAVCRRLLLTNRKWQLYHTWDDPGCRLQGTRTILPGKTPSKTTGNDGGELYQKSWTKRDEKGEHFESRLLVELDRGHRTGLTHAENGRLHGVSQRTSTYAQEWCKKMRAAELQIHLNRWIAEQGKFLYLDAF